MLAVGKLVIDSGACSSIFGHEAGAFRGNAVVNSLPKIRCSVNMLSAILRTAGFLAIWLALAGPAMPDVAAGVVASIIATVASLYLIPPGSLGFSLWAAATYTAHFLWQSTVAGFDVAFRALTPDMRLRPGFVTYKPDCPEGLSRSAFCAVTSLMPGTLPTGRDADGYLVIHCLDVGQPVVEQLSQEEALIMRVLGDVS